jgi:uncharacterized protein YdeI (YjbR/CyaY-like superfamily)
MKDGKSIIFFDSPAAFEMWLSESCSTSGGVWVRFYKKDSGVKSLNYDEALDVALCYGWIDGQVNKYDEKSYLQKFTPRRARSSWSKRNTQHVARLIKEGRMKPAGLVEVERAKADGRWEKAYESSANITPPDDFIAALSKNKQAEDFWKTLNKSNVYAFLFRIHSAKKEETRTKRIEQFVEMLSRHEKLH